MPSSKQKTLELYNKLTTENAKEELDIEDYQLEQNLHDIRVEKEETKHFYKILVILQFERGYVEHEDLEAFADDNDLVIKYHETVDGKYQVTLERNISKK